MTGPPSRRFLLLLVAAVVFATAVTDSTTPGQDGAKTEVSIAPNQAPGNVFGGEDVSLRFRVAGPRPAAGKVVWRVALGTATVKAGELSLGAGDVTVKFAAPDAKDGVFIPLRLTLSVVAAGQPRPAATLEHDLTVFPRDPFTDRTEWLKGLDLRLFDPKGTTAKVLTAAKVPFEEIRTVDALADVKVGVVVVGEGTSFKDERGLGAALPKLAASGVAVLVLAPADGELPVPGLGGPVGGLGEVAFGREMVRRLDKRLDPDGWAGDGPTVTRTIAVKPGEDGIVGEVAVGNVGWTWAEARQSPGRGRWLFCGLAVVTKWDAGPTPRFLFARMLEHLTGPESGNPKKEDGR
ncbi:hypothetical protein J0H58_22180 [bacterium]|nr:hypothetical protein [bacterium]